MGPLAYLLSVLGEGVFAAGAIFARVGGLVFLLPGLGERAVTMRFKLVVAVMLTLLLLPLIAPRIPETPTEPVAYLPVLAGEAASGLVLGLAFRLLIFVLQIAGTIAAQHISVAQMFGSGVAPEPEPTIASLLTMGGIVLLMLAGLHVQVVAALAGSYELLPFGRFPQPGVLGDWSVARMSETFAAGLSLALPLVVASFIYNMALGALSRAMPQLLVAMIGVPALIGIGLGTLWLVLPELFARWMARAAAVLDSPLGGLGP